jgi:hypothetical protein
MGDGALTRQILFAACRLRAISGRRATGSAVYIDRSDGKMIGGARANNQRPRYSSIGFLIYNEKFTGKNAPWLPRNLALLKIRSTALKIDNLSQSWVRQIWRAKYASAGRLRAAQRYS